VRRPAAGTLAAGLALGAVYVAVLALTAGGRRALPLYDGFAPPPRYQWVNPPAPFVAGNRVPGPKRTEVTLGSGGSAQEGFSSDDGQLVLNLPAGAIPAAGPAAGAAVTITPIDPATLAPLPGGASADGNAYRVDITYVPTGPAVTALGAPGSALLTVPQTPDKLFGSPDGQAWTQIELVPVDNSRLSFRVSTPGYVLASAAPVTSISVPRSSHDVGRTLAAAGATLVLAGCLYLGPIAVRRLRGRRSPG
jgi:hypothetical protein